MKPRTLKKKNSEKAATPVAVHTDHSASIPVKAPSLTVARDLHLLDLVFRRLETLLLSVSHCEGTSPPGPMVRRKRGVEDNGGCVRG